MTLAVMHVWLRDSHCCAQAGGYACGLKTVYMSMDMTCHHVKASAQLCVVLCLYAHVPDDSQELRLASSS
eukprot:1792903-Amphidinium_carterae.1